MKVIRAALLIIVLSSNCYAGNSTIPKWFLQTFTFLKLEKQFRIIESSKPVFLEADFNGDKQNDIAVQVIDLKSKKKGIIIIDGGQNNYSVFGCGKKFADEIFSDTNWITGWRIFKSKYAYKPMFNADGDIIGNKKIILKNPAISIYNIEDGDEVAGQIIYWNGNKYVSIHQGE
ncbi:hypothetical protein [Mucilaginibacter sp. KACC 22063]|uniref:hypothetical protein n=1 Tax=Mucilaginibacter sp. KACC 22063 TaxID=3025666 RepID=UPI002365C6A8|nr:hypothetical protein [Mucilaginibacter sp. KACC 22063]WDF56279.1 hypothetical protein PQ461_04290 [Mucilaginibacter sp. KACC 22063]